MLPPVLETVRLCPLNISVQTDLGGLAVVNVKVPGTFNGFNGYAESPSSGRYLSSFDLWADIGEAGDRAYGFQLVDTDGVIPVPARASFPNYPVIFNFYDDAVVETDDIKAGLRMRPGIVTSLHAPSNLLNFIPSGLYITGSIQAGTAGLGKVFRCNLIWGKAVPPISAPVVVS